MKNFYLIVLLFVFVNPGFTSYSSDKDDNDHEVFFSEEAIAKVMIKGNWTVNSLSIKSNFPAYDLEFNKAST